MEKMYLILKAQQDLNESRRNRLVEITEATSSINDQDVDVCPHVQHLRQLSREKLQDAQVFVSAADAVALTENSATVKVSINGTDYSTCEPNQMLAFLSVDFEAASAEICFMSLLWVTP